jgi:hypothetical protein
MQHQQNQSHNQGGMNKSSGDVECKKSEQPKNNQNCGDNPKHNFISLFSADATCDLSFEIALMPLQVRKRPRINLSPSPDIRLSRSEHFGTLIHIIRSPINLEYAALLAL